MVYYTRKGQTMANKKDFSQIAAAAFITTTEEAPKEPKAKPKRSAKKGTELPGEEMKAPKGYRLLPEIKSERLQLLIKPSTKEALKKIAKEKGESVNDIANKLFEEFINGKG